MVSSDISTKLDDETAYPADSKEPRVKAGPKKDRKSGQPNATGSKSNSDLSMEVKKPNARGATKKGKAKAARATAEAPVETKSETVLKLLRAGKGASIQAMMEATGWQPHSVRGFLSATVKKKLGLTLTSETGKDGVRRYKIA